MDRGIVIRLFEYAESKGLTQQQIADILGISRGIVNNWKAGRNEPEDKRILDIVTNIQDIDANWLIRGYPMQTMSNNQSGSYNINQQGNDNQVADPGSNIWKERFEAAERIIREKEEQINILKSVLKI